MIDFSILIPTRARPQQLELLLLSIKKHTSNIKNIEVVFIIDADDKSYLFYKQALENSRQIGLITSMLVGKRKENFPSYYNEMASFSSGKNLWVLNDDCMIMTQGWDDIARDLIINFQKKNHHDVWYGDIGDTTRNFNNNGQYSCFPMMSRSSFYVLGYFFNPKIIAWGTDKYLKHVFIESGAGIIDMLGIMVNHVHEREDETHAVLINRLKSNAGQECTVDYGPDIEKLRKAIQL